MGMFAFRRMHERNEAAAKVVASALVSKPEIEKESKPKVRRRTVKPKLEQI
jgi:hypothetical protein